MIGCACLCLSAALAGCRPAPERVVVCFGDSLTACGGPGGRYSDMLAASLPEYEFINSGKGGDTIGGGLARLESDVLAHHPGYLIVGLGANDYWLRQRSLEELREDYETMISRCRAEGIEVLMISCFGNETLPEGRMPDFSRPGVSLEEYASGIAVFERELAAKYRCGYVPDMQSGLLPKGRPDLWDDSNHPNAAGNRIVADTILPELRKLPGF